MNNYHRTVVNVINPVTVITASVIMNYYYYYYYCYCYYYYYYYYPG
jgi:hypothetical protein